MSPTLLASKCPGEDVQGILRRLVAAVAKDIEALPERTEDRVHDIRVRMKKFRAILRLAEPALKPGTLEKSDKLARSLKDHFGSARDNDVQKELLLDLLEKGEALAAVEALGLDAGGPHLDADAAPARETCAALAALVGQYHLAKLTCDSLLEAWLSGYRSSCRAMRACRKDADDDFLFHEWRKRVKAFLYQSATIGPPLGRFVPKADRLASVLGSHHDLAILTLAILTDRLAGRLSGSKAERAALSRKKLIARRALVLGEKLFSKKPSALHKKALLP
ncbi:MAG: CHAD domain-containing protein [Verrucomicrobia bacterium]|nr:CHAD domain-containing protein [Verrucomicrobiota bacterium]